MTSSESVRSRRRAKLAVRRSFSLTPSPLRLPSPVNTLQNGATIPYASPTLLPSHVQSSRHSESSRHAPTLVHPPHLDLVARRRLESQVDHILHRLEEETSEGEVAHGHGHPPRKGAESASTTASTAASRAKLQVELDHLLQGLDDCHASQYGLHLPQGESTAHNDLLRVGKPSVPEDEPQPQSPVAEDAASGHDVAQQQDDRMVDTPASSKEAETGVLTADSASAYVARNAVSSNPAYLVPSNHGFRLPDTVSIDLLTAVLQKAPSFRTDSIH
jgi:hypothetical protein